LRIRKKKPPAALPINPNAATSEELQLVPGIGPGTAKKILQMRRGAEAAKENAQISHDGKICAAEKARSLSCLDPSLHHP
jgi:hypothetical protein